MSHTGERLMTQVAPWPYQLDALLQTVEYRPGWSFALEDMDRAQGSQGLTLIITTRGYDSYHQERGQFYGVLHYFPVPPAAFDERSWLAWLFEQILLVERHEACEFFKVLTGETDVEPLYTRPYAPSHGPGNNPYLVRELGTLEDQRTSARGVIKTHPGPG